MWEIRPERARRVNHPAPFPVELPERFIRLYTYVGDVVLDPFLGSGSTAVAAARTGRHYVGYDLDPEYVAIAEARVAEAREADRRRRRRLTSRGPAGRTILRWPCRSVLGVSVTSNLYLFAAFGAG